MLVSNVLSLDIKFFSPQAVPSSCALPCILHSGGVAFHRAFALRIVVTGTIDPALLYLSTLITP